MYNLDIALEALDIALENLGISNYHNVCDISAVNECVYMMQSNDDIALEGILSKIKNFFTMNKNKPKENDIDPKDIDRTMKKLNKIEADAAKIKKENKPTTISEYTLKIASQIYRDTNPFGPMIPITFTWLCLTNFADLYRDFLKKNPNGINMVEFINYALDNPRLKCAFMLRYYDRETKSIKESFFTTETTNPYFQQVLGFTFKDAVGDCMIESVKKLLKKETYDEYAKDGIPMAYVYTRSFMYEYNKDKGTVGLYAFKINDDLMTGLSYSKGDSEIMYLPNKMDKELMESKVIKDLIAWK